MGRNILGSGTGQDPDRIFQDPDPEIRNFWASQDFSGLRIFQDLSWSCPEWRSSKKSGFFRIKFSRYDD
jgi:hypothetical protein